MQSAVSAKNLAITIGNTKILQDVTIDITQGSITGLLGPSGAGKTTLMRTIVGLQKPSSGTIDVLGKPAGHKFLRSQIGYMTQNLSIYPDLTVLENLMYFAAVVGTGKQSVTTIIDRLQLQGLEHHLISEVSGGQKTRVSLGAALLGKPPLLVLDEPTVGIDPLIRSEIWEFLHEIATQGTTLIVSSHVMDEAAHCTNLILLRDGRVLANGAPDELKRKSGQHTIEETFLHLVRSKS